jgi:hypothetical protein
MATSSCVDELMPQNYPLPAVWQAGFHQQPDGGFLPKAATAHTPPVIYSREMRAELVFMTKAKFSAADAAELRPGQPVDVVLR